MERKTGKKILAAACAALVIGAGALVLIKGWRNGSGNADKGKQAEESDGEKQLKEFTADSALQTAKSYKEVYKCIKNQEKNENTGEVEYATEEAASDSTSSAVSDGASADGGSGRLSAQREQAAGYSETNIREEGVSEADIVKTDGKYLYILNQKKIRIIDVQGQTMKEAGKITLESEVYPEEVYVENGKLLVFYTMTEYHETDSDEYGAGYQEYTVAETFDVLDPSDVKSLGKIKQSGDYDSVRINGGYCYLFSRQYVYSQGKSKNPEDYIPLVQGKRLDSECIYVPETDMGNLFFMFSSFALTQPDQILDSKAVLGAYGSECYVSGENIYVYEEIEQEKEDYNQTYIRKISYKEGKLQGLAQVKVWGGIKDSFCIDEYQGNLRLVTTVEPIYHYKRKTVFSQNSSTASSGTTSNALYVLDEELNVKGKIEKLAPEEKVYSARFMGDRGYFVTYEEVDPLFSVDLSVPENPKVQGALKIPGFSEYLHPYGDGKLLGIGTDTDQSGINNGIKLSMFDISAPSDVGEAEKEVLEGCYSADVLYNYKAALLDVESNLIGFAAGGSSRYYYVYSYDSEVGFTCLLEKELNAWTYDIRGLRVNNILYLVEGGAIEAFDLSNFEKVDDIVL